MGKNLAQKARQVLECIRAIFARKPAAAGIRFVAKMSGKRRGAGGKMTFAQEPTVSGSADGENFCVSVGKHGGCGGGGSGRCRSKNIPLKTQ